jgi:AcrR family transcriptional regulator
MVKKGSKRRPSAKTEDTRRDLIEGTKEVLRREGFSAATARNIASRAGCNQGLVFYHFGSVVGLLLAALDEVSAERKIRYEAALEKVTKPSDLVELAAVIFEEDLDTGDAALLVEMIAGASSTPGLGAEVMQRVAPWTQFAASALDSFVKDSPLASVVSAEEAAHAVVALYLGLELLSHLDGNRQPAMALFERTRQLASIADLIAGTPKDLVAT